MAPLIPCIQFTHVSSRGRAWLSGRPPWHWSATASPTALGEDLPRLFQASKLAHADSLRGWGVTSSLLTVEGKWSPRLWFSALHSCRDASVLQLLLSLQPSLPAQQGRAGRKEWRVQRGREQWEWREQWESGAGLAVWGAGVHQHSPNGTACCGRAGSGPSAARAPAASLHPQSTRIFVFPGLADKAASPLIRRPGEWDQHEAGVLRS